MGKKIGTVVVKIDKAAEVKRLSRKLIKLPKNEEQGSSCQEKLVRPSCRQEHP